MVDFIRCKTKEGAITYLNTEKIDCFFSCLTPQGEAGYAINALDRIFYVPLNNLMLADLIIKSGGNLIEEIHKRNCDKPIMQRESSSINCEDPFQDELA